jgi:hypothetical protein
MGDILAAVERPSKDPVGSCRIMLPDLQWRRLTDDARIHLLTSAAYQKFVGTI